MKKYYLLTLISMLVCSIDYIYDFYRYIKYGDENVQTISGKTIVVPNSFKFINKNATYLVKVNNEYEPEKALNSYEQFVTYKNNKKSILLIKNKNNFIFTEKAIKKCLINKYCELLLVNNNEIVFIKNQLGYWYYFKNIDLIITIQSKEVDSEKLIYTIKII